MYPLAIPIIGWLFTPVAMLILILAYPLFMLSAALGMREYARVASSADVNDDEIYVKEAEGNHLTVKWDEVRLVQKRFNPPFFYWSLELDSGQSIPLHQCKTDELVRSAKQNNVTVPTKWKYEG